VLERDFVFSAEGRTLNHEERKMANLSELDSILIWHQYVKRRALGAKGTGKGKK
jgi:hypothetical protein